MTPAEQQLEFNRLAPLVWTYFALDEGHVRVARSEFNHCPAHVLACYRAIYNSLRPQQ